jgi:hypothetical protein
MMMIGWELLAEAEQQPKEAESLVIDGKEYKDCPLRPKHRHQQHLRSARLPQHCNAPYFGAATEPA